MELDETMVEQNDNVEADDALPEDVVEEQDESEESMESFLEDEVQQPEEKPKEEPQGTSEPGWIKGRINAAVEKALNQQRQALMAEMDAKYAPIRDRLLEMDARELVRQGEFKSLDRAKEYLQLKQGIAPTPKQEQPRQPNGQYARKEDPGTSARIDMLSHQAAKIKASTGLDVIDVWNSNEEIKRKVVSGEMDFYDVAEQMKAKPRRKPPAPMRSPNGVNNIGPNSIESMSDAQFKKLDKMLDEGMRFTIKR